MPMLPPVRPNFTTSSADAADFWTPATDPYPSTLGKWQRRYQWLWDAYLGTAYSDDDYRALSLFRVKSDAEEDISVTTRIVRDVQHIVDTDTRAIAGPKLSLEPTAGNEAHVGDGQRVWRRSNLQDRKALWARTCAAMGDIVIEAVRTDAGTKLVMYEPQFCEVVYSDDGTEVEKIRIVQAFQDPDGLTRTYVRILDKTKIEAYEMDPRAEGDRSDAGSGEHHLGVVPAVHIKFTEMGPPEHGLPATHAMEKAIGAVDSLAAQAFATSKRTAAPFLALFGFQLTTADKQALGKLGRTLSSVKDATSVDAKYVEPNFGAIMATWEMTKSLLAETRATVPEFLFAGSGANTSGYALDIRADQFRLKMEEVRGRFYSALALVTQYAVLMDRMDAFDPDDLWFRIQAPPVLPIDKNAHLQALMNANAMQAIKRVDLVRGLQVLGVIDPELDPEAYASDLEAEHEPPPEPVTPSDPEDDPGAQRPPRMPPTE